MLFKELSSALASAAHSTCTCNTKTLTSKERLSIINRGRIDCVRGTREQSFLSPLTVCFIFQFIPIISTLKGFAHLQLQNLNVTHGRPPELRIIVVLYLSLAHLLSHS